jgi:hypothetical protein
MLCGEVAFQRAYASFNNKFIIEIIKNNGAAMRNLILFYF